jgi:hypothetical protein
MSRRNNDWTDYSAIGKAITDLPGHRSRYRARQGYTLGSPLWLVRVWSHPIDIAAAINVYTKYGSENRCDVV